MKINNKAVTTIVYYMGIYLAAMLLASYCHYELSLIRDTVVYVLTVFFLEIFDFFVDRMSGRHENDK